MVNYAGYVSGGDNVGAFSPTAAQRNMAPSWNRFWGHNWGGESTSYTGWGTNWNTDWGGTRTGSWFPAGTLALVTYGPPVVPGGIHTLVRPIGFRNYNFPGSYNVGSFSDVFYNRILIEPVDIDFGNILSTQQEVVKVWNAFFFQVTLDDMIKVNFDVGTFVEDITLPFLFNGLQELEVVITATTSGAPTVDANLIFDFQVPIEDISVSVRGSRIVLFPVEYKPDLTETFSWLTEILNSYNGTEQRIRMRNAPRQSLDVRAHLPKDELHRVENLMYGWRKRIWAIPIWTDAKPLTSPVTAGDFIVYADTTYSDFRIGSLAILWRSPREFAVFQIIAFDDTSLTTNRGITGDWPVTAQVIPVRGAIMTRDPRRSFNGWTGYVDASFLVTDNIVIPSSPSPEQFNGYDVFLLRNLIPGGATEAQDAYEQRIDRVDFGTGLVTTSGPWANTRVPRTFEIEMTNLEEVWEFKEWINRRAGKVRPFYMPTFENNFVIISQGTILGAFTAKPNDYQSQSLPRNHIAFLMKDGTYAFATVVDAVSDENGNLAVSFTPSLNAEASEIDEVSIMTLRRFDSDNISIQRLQNEVSFAKIPTIEIAP